VSSKKNYNPRRHLIVVTTFIVAASLLVVLTTFAINMLTATGDLNRLLVRWSQNNGESIEKALAYMDNGDESSMRAYQDFKEQRMYTGDVISELMTENPNKDLIFQEFDPTDIHPNEITGLIRIFTLFEQKKEIKDIKRTWAKVTQLSQEKNALIDSVMFRTSVTEKDISDVPERIQAKNREINNYVRNMISDNAGILLLLKRYSLWFTVLLGILIVLIGVIFTVRGMKNIQNTQNLLTERDYLAKFPELNQFPVLNLNVSGGVDFINQATRSLFPNLQQQGISHPFLKEIRAKFPKIINEPESTQLFEVQVDGKFYQQAVHFLSDEQGIHVHCIDITDLKNKQLQLRHTLKEKESLLAEVHHRVKNNMAVTTGLLELQEMMGQDPATALSESRSRIKSMAIIHELLYQSDSFSEIDPSDFLTKIGDHLRLSLSNIASIEVQKTAKKPGININQAVPLALLLNELTIYLSQESSSRHQQIDLQLQLLALDEKMCLRLRSPQSGVNNPLDNDDKPTLRMSLIKNLLAQIEGTLHMPKHKHLLVEIVFTQKIKKGSSSTLI
jgi:two-component sensor histidine kinase